MALTDEIATLPSSVPPLSSGHPGHHQTIHAALKNLDPRVTAVEQRIPSSAAVTIDTGYGVRIGMGGKTVYGETPWVDVTSMLSPAPSSGTLKMRRVGDWLHFDVAYLVYSAGVAPTLALPGPWRTGLNAGALLLSSASTTVGRARLTYDGKLTLYYDTASSAPSCALSFPVQAGTAWPTSAPA